MNSSDFAILKHLSTKLNKIVDKYILKIYS